MPIVLSPISNSFNPLPSARTSRARVLASYKLPQVPYPLQRLAFPTTYRPRSGANRLEPSIHSFCHIPPTRWPPRRYPKCPILYNGVTICRPVYSIGVPIVLTAISSKFNARPVRAGLARPCPGLLQATPSAVSSTTTRLPNLLSTPLVCQSFAVYCPLSLTLPARAPAPWPPRSYPKCPILYNDMACRRPANSVGVPIVTSILSDNFNVLPLCPSLVPVVSWPSYLSLLMMI
jgi:hypothetical protein